MRPGTLNLVVMSYSWFVLLFFGTAFSRPGAAGFQCMGIGMRRAAQASLLANAAVRAVALRRVAGGSAVGNHGAVSLLKGLHSK